MDDTDSDKKNNFNLIQERNSGRGAEENTDWKPQTPQLCIDTRLIGPPIDVHKWLVLTTTFLFFLF